MTTVQKLTNFNHQLRTLIPQSSRSKNVTFGLVLVATVLDNFSVAGSMTTFASVMEHFNTNSTTASWSLSAYALTLGAFIMLAGKMTDIIGPETVFLTGLFFNGIFALICAAIEQQIIVMIVFRAIQGIFASSLIPSSFAIAGAYYQGKYLGYAITALILSLTSVYSIALVVGGAFATGTSIGYKGIHYITFAISIFVCILFYMMVYPIPRTEAHKGLSLKNLDYGGCALFVISLTLIILGLTEGGNSWHRPVSYVCLVIGVLLLLFVFFFEVFYLQSFKDKAHQKVEESKEDERSEEHSLQSYEKLKKDWRYDLQLLFPKEVFQISNFNLYAFSTLLIYVAYILVTVSMTQYFQYVNRDSALMAGVKVLPVSLGLTFGAYFNKEGWIYKVGMKRMLMVSPVLGCCMLGWLSCHDFETSKNYWKYECFSVFFYAYSVNLYFNIYLNAVMRRSPVHLHGVVSGLLQTIGQLGICLGNSIFSSIVGELDFTDDVSYRRHLHSKFQIPIYVAIGLTGAMFFVFLFISNQKTVEEESEEVTGEAESSQHQIESQREMLSEADGEKGKQ